MANSTVYFTNELTPEAVVKMYRQLHRAARQGGRQGP